MPEVGALLTKFQIADVYGKDIGDGRGGYGQWGVWPLRDANELVLVVTLDHTKRPEKHRYIDHFESPEILVWNSQPTTTPQSTRGRDYTEQRKRATTVHLYARGDKFAEDDGQLPFVYLGLVDEAGWSGSAPMTVRWQLRQPVPRKHWSRLFIPLEREPPEIRGPQDWQVVDPESARQVADVRMAIESGNYRAEDGWSLTKKRAGQAAFREKVLELHDGACVVCGLGDPRLLDACHIVPWRDDVENRLNPANGLALCVLHHRALDRGILAIDRAGIISAEEGPWADGDVGKASIGVFRGRQIVGAVAQVLPFLQAAGSTGR